ncbi:MAG: NHL repeat-containing protein, partial [Caldisericaceae bacterium]
MKRIALIIVIVYIVQFVAPLSNVYAISVKNISVVQDIAVPAEDFVGSNSLAEANLYESDYNSKYLFPMQGMCLTDDGRIAVIDNAYGRVHVLNSLLQNSYTFGSLAQLIYPTDISFYSNSFYISDPLGKSVQVFSKTGSFVKTISQGLDAPTGVAVTKDGIFVSDYFVGKVLKLDFNGNVLKSVAINFPGGLSTNGTNIIAVSMSDDKIFVLDSNLNITKSFVGKELLFPSDTCSDSKGNIYVVDRGLARGGNTNGRVVVYNSSGAFVSSIGTAASAYPNQPDGSLLTPSGITIDSFGSVYVMDSGFYYWVQESDAPFGFPIGARISVFSQAGVFISKKNFNYDTPGILLNPTSATLDENGNMWVVNKGGFDDSELVEFSISGKYIKTIKTSGSMSLQGAMCVYADKKGSIYVGIDGAIVAFSSSGAYKATYSSKSLGAVKKITKGNDGNLYATSQDLNTVTKMTAQGAVLSNFNVCVSPAGIAQSANGNFFVTSLDDNKIYVYDTGFKFLRTIGSGGGRDSMSMYVPEDIAVDKYGNIIVADTENGRISVFSQDGSLLYQSGGTFYEIVSLESEGST